MAKFMLILHEPPTEFASLTPEQMQAVVEEYGAWAARMAEEQRLLDSHKLKDEGGRWITRQGGRLRVVDGPFAEAKEVVGGYFVLEAADYDEAIELASTCPHVAHGRIELREVDALETPEG